MSRIIFLLLLTFLTNTQFAQDIKTLITNDTTYSFTDPEFELLSASSEGDTAKLLAFLKIGTDVNTTNWDGVSPLMYAAQNGHLECVKILIDKGADVNAKPYSQIDALTGACIAGHVMVADTLILNGANVDSRNNDGMTPLMWAAAYNYDLLADMLIFYGAKVNTADVYGNTPLHFSCFYNSWQTTALLLEKEAALDATDFKGFTPLMLAAQNGHLQNLDLLLKNGADINKTNQQNLSALALAIIGHQTEAVSDLLVQGANSNAFISNKLDLYTLALISNQKQVVKILDTTGIAPYKKDLIYQWGIHYLVDFNSKDVMMGGIFSLSEIKYHLTFEAGYRTRPAVRSVLFEKDPQTVYQFWEKRSMLHLAVSKSFSLVQFDLKQKLNAFAGLGLGYTYGSFRGSSLKPENGFLLIPVAGLEYQYDVFSLKINYEYLKLKNSTIPANRIEFLLGINFNVFQNKLKLKEEPIY